VGLRDDSQKYTNFNFYKTVLASTGTALYRKGPAVTNSSSVRNACTFEHASSVPMLDETSALHGNMPQRNDEEGGKQPRLSFSPAASVWGQMGRAWTTGGRNAPRTTESITEKDYVAFFHQFFGLTNNPALAPFANVPCPSVLNGW